MAFIDHKNDSSPDLPKFSSFSIEIQVLFYKNSYIFSKKLTIF